MATYTDNFNHKVLDKKWLYQKYINEEKSSTDIGKLCHMNRFEVINNLHKHKIKTRKRTNKKVVNNNYFDKINTEEKAYWLGFITADGNVSKKYCRIQIVLAIVDKMHLEKFATIFEKKVKVYEKCPGKCFFSLYNRKMYNDLLSIGVVPAKTDEDQSVIFDFIPDTFKKSFVRGLFDGDGSIAICSTKKDFTFSIAGEDRLLSKVSEYIYKKVGINKKETEKYHRMSIIRWGGKTQCTAIFKWLYKDSNIFLERKHNKFLDMCKLKSKAKYHGVATTRNKISPWNAFIWINNKRIHIGNFSSEIEAAKAYDLKAKLNGFPKYKINFEAE